MSIEPTGKGLRVRHCYAGHLNGGIEALLATPACRGAQAPGMVPESTMCDEGCLADHPCGPAAAIGRLLGLLAGVASAPVSTAGSARP